MCDVIANLDENDTKRMHSPYEKCRIVVVQIKLNFHLEYIYIYAKQLVAYCVPATYSIPKSMTTCEGCVSCVKQITLSISSSVRRLRAYNNVHEQPTRRRRRTCLRVLKLVSRVGHTVTFSHSCHTLTCHTHAHSARVKMHVLHALACDRCNAIWPMAIVVFVVRV